MSRQSEREAAQQSGGYLTYNSGAGKHEKGDTILHKTKIKFYVEDKATSASVWYLPRVIWEKACREAEQRNYEPAVRVTVSGCAPVAVLPLKIWKELGGDIKPVEESASRTLKIEREGSLRWVKESTQRIWGHELVIVGWQTFLDLLNR